MPLRRPSALIDRILARWPSSSRRFQAFTLFIFALGALAIYFESATVYDHGSSVVRQSVEWLQLAMTGATETDIAELPAAPPPVFTSDVDRMCYYQRDLGLLDEIRTHKKVFCKSPSSSSSPTRRTEVTLVDLRPLGAWVRGVVFKHDLELDFTGAKILRHIKSIAKDGGGHDPRFVYRASIMSCGCEELEQHAHDVAQEASPDAAALRLWDPQLANSPASFDHTASVCGASFTPAGAASASPAPMITIAEKTILIARRDDHNPFFQVSNALNAWLMMRALGWKRDDVRVIHMDGGFESPVDELHKRLLSSSKFELLRGRENLMGHKFKFTGEVMLPTYETWGPMMEHLNDDEPCQRSQLITEFRHEALQVMGVTSSDHKQRGKIVVTVITRRDYSGRRVQRRWLNEDEVLDAMRLKYPTQNGVPIVIQSIDFVSLSLQQQMQIVLDSDVIIGMHGAGMVNVMWTRPETLVIEIFPKYRRRWGYRNICQFIGCEWYQYRGGKDTGKGDNSSDKTIPVESWLHFFGPLFTAFLEKIEPSGSTRVASAVENPIDLPQRLRR